MVFEKYDIPYFMDVHKTVDVKPVIRFVNSVFRIILDDFEREDVLSLLKTGLTNNSPDEISIFENYVFIWNINGSAFKSEFKQNPRGFSDKFSESDTKNLRVAEKVRKSIVESLLYFKDNIKDKNGREITTQLYDLLCKFDVPKTLGNMDSSSAFNKLDKMEEKIEAKEAQAEAFTDLAGTSNEPDPFAQLEADSAVDAEMARLMAELGQTAPAADGEGTGI